MKRIVAVLLLLGVMVPGCASTPYKRIAHAYNILGYTRDFGEQVDAGIKAFLEAKRTECKAKHAIKTAEYDACVLPAVRLSRVWTGEKNGKPTGKGALPLLQAGQKTTKLALDGAYDYVVSHEAECSKAGASKECSGDWMVMMKPGLCAAWVVVDACVKAGAFKATESKTYKAVEGAAALFGCGK